MLQWTDNVFIIFMNTKIDRNYDDSLNKPTVWTKFYEHTDILMGRKRPIYIDKITSPNLHSQEGIVHYLSLSTYRTKPMVSLLQYDSLHCFDSISVA